MNLKPCYWRSGGWTAVAYLPDFVFQKQGNSSVWLARKYAASADAARIADADGLFESPECEIVKDQRKIKVGRIRVSLGGEVRTLYVKRYNSFSWRMQLASLFRDSGAVRALRGAAVLLNARIAAAKPVAAVESRFCGMVTKSFFLTEEINDGKTVDAYWRDDLSTLAGRVGFRRRRGFLGALASLFQSLHGQHVYHDDLKDANILVVPGSRAETDNFFLLDLEGIRNPPRLSERRRMKNLVQLNRTLGRYLGRAERLCFLKRYMGAACDDRRRRRLWAKKILRRSSRLDRRKFAAGAAVVLT